MINALIFLFVNSCLQNAYITALSLSLVRVSSYPSLKDCVGQDREVIAATGLDG